MLCTLKVRRALSVSEQESPFQVKISSKHAVGGAGGLISDEASYPSLPSLLQALADLRLPGDLLLSSPALAELEKAEDRWLPLVTDVQITFEVLTTAGFSLHEVSD